MVINKVSEFKQFLADRTSARFHISVQCKSAAYHGVLGTPSKVVTTRSKTNIATIWREVEDIKIGKKILNLAFHCNYAV
jgi:hypothetical protein